MAKRVTWIMAADKGWHLPALFLCLLIATVANAQYVSPYIAVQGTLTTSSGLAAQNSTLTFSPSQVMFVAGTSLIVQESQCGTDMSGSVVGIGNPVTGPRVNAQNTGTLIPGNYYVRYTWYDQFGIQTLASPEVAVQLTHTGELQVLPPVGTGPPQATGLDIYIGTTPGGETYQGQTTSLTAQYTQATNLSTTGNAPPIRNLTVCRVVANDAGFPTGTGYNVSLLDASGNTLFSYPEMWQFFGPGSTYNLSSGIPYYHGEVTYPIPILTIPFNHNPQSISGALSLSGYNLYSVGAIGVGTATPAWGVDVEGSGTLGEINAAGGYLVNGLAGSAGQAPCSDGTAVDQFCTFVSAGTLFYQIDQSNGTAVTPAAANNFSSRFALTSVTGATDIDLSASGVTAGTYTYPSSVTIDTYGRTTAISSGTAVGRTCNSVGCYREEQDGTIEEWGRVVDAGGSTYTVSFPIPFSSATTYAFTATGTNTTSGSTRDTVYVTSWTASAVVVGTDGSDMAFNWHAIGY